MTEIKDIFDSFVRTLDENMALSRHENPLKTLSEDTICFFLAASFLQHGVHAHSIQMEVRHPVLAPESETAVDVYVDGPDGPIWVEVKFDKTTSNSHFGNLINDICRLALIQKGTSLMLYVDAGEIKRLGSLDPRFLGSDPFCFDARFFEKLHKDVKKGLKKKVAEKLVGAAPSVKLVAQRVNGSPACLLYEINSQSRY